MGKLSATYTPTGCLLNAIRRDKEKGGGGMRSTREVAEFTGLTMAAARRQLWKLEEAGLVDAYDGGASGLQGNAIDWRMKEQVHKGDRVMVVRPIGAVDTIVKGKVTGIFKECILPIQVEFEDGLSTGYLHQEIKEIVR